MNSLERGKRAAALTVLVTFLRGIIQGGAGYLIGSSALMTAALESLSDVLTSASSWAGLKLAQRDPDKQFPYGYYKAESLASLVVSAIIIYAGINFLLEGYSRLLNPVLISDPGIGAAAAIVSIVVSYLLFKHLSQVASQTNSQSIKANADDKLTDIFSSFFVLIGVISGLVGLPWLEGVATLLISLFVLKLGFENGKNSLFALMDVSPSKEIESKTRRIVGSFKEVKHIKHLKLRKAGPFVFGEVEIEMAGSIDVNRAHAITENIQKKAISNIPPLDSLAIHVEPHKRDTQVLAIPMAEDRGMDSKLLGQLGRAKYFFVVQITKGKVSGSKTLKNPFWNDKSRTGLRTANLLSDSGADAVVVKNIGEIAFHTIRDKFIEVYRTKGDTVQEVVERFIEGKLELLTTPTRESGKARK